MADRPSDTPNPSGAPGSRGSSGSGGAQRPTGPTGPGASPSPHTAANTPGNTPGHPPNQPGHQPPRQAARPLARPPEGPRGEGAHPSHHAPQAPKPAGAPGSLPAPLADGPGHLGPAAVAALIELLGDEPALGLALVDADGRTIASNRRFVRLTVPRGAAEGATASTHDPAHAHTRATSAGRRGVWARVGPDAVRTARTSGKPAVLRFIHEGAQVQCDVWPLASQDPMVVEGPAYLVVAVQGRFDPGGADWAATGRAGAQCEPKPGASPPASDAEERFTTLAPMLAELGELEALTARELEVLALIGQGMATRDIAETLGRSPRTVERHCDAIHKKLGTNNRVQMARYAMRAGLTAEAGKLKRV